MNDRHTREAQSYEPHINNNIYQKRSDLSELPDIWFLYLIVVI